MEKNFRGKKLFITVKNPDAVQSGVKEIVINGKTISGNYVPVSEMSETNNIEVILG